jgi:hypothetical protein
MLNEWFYSHSTWTVAALVCGALMLVPICGLFFFHRMVDWHSREKDTSMVGLSYALVGGIYAVVLAFVAVGVYQTMDKGAAIASEEANSLSAIAFDSAGLPAELGVKVRSDVDKYIDIVTKKEWPTQQAYKMEEKNFEEGWTQIRQMNQDISTFEPVNLGQTTVKADMIRVVNEMFSARRARLLAANAHLPDAVWQMLVFGLVLVVFYVYLFGPHSFKVHMTVMAMTMLSIGLVFTLVIALDYPFRGELSVSDEAFVGVKEVVAHAFEGAGEGKATGEHEGGGKSTEKPAGEHKNAKIHEDAEKKK